MKSDLLPVLLEELFAVSSLPVFGISLSGLGVVYDVFLQNRDLAKTSFQLFLPLGYRCKADHEIYLDHSCIYDDKDTRR